MQRRKELEAQKARIVAQMAPVREEEDRYEVAVATVNERRLPERKEIRKPSVKENRLPGLLVAFLGVPISDILICSSGSSGCSYR